MKLKTFILTPAIMILIILLCLSACDDSHGPMKQIDLVQGFTAPPNEARPNVMWWWLNSAISEKGITRDLEEMARQGIGGALIFDAAPVDRWKPKDVAPAPVGPPFMSERWRELFRHAIKESDRLGIELGVSITSGFNAGGPWVTPEYGQQEIVWSELIVDSAMTGPIKLPLPAGPVFGEQGELLNYSELKVNNDLERGADGFPLHYRDIAVLAIPLEKVNPKSAGKIPDIKTSSGRLKNWSLKSVHSFDYKESKGFDFGMVYESIEDVPGEPQINTHSIVDVSDFLDESGMLNWQVPKGKWMLLRFGHTHTGIRLQATNPNNQGLAMNHLSKEAARRHFDEIALKMLDDIKSVNGQNPVYFYLDSWEVRIANWTAEFRQEFQDRRGYDMTPYLPVLAGMIVDNRDISNRFLHDYRMTIGDCIADNYYGAFAELSHENGMQYRAEMATTPLPIDMLKCLGRVDLPFGEFWTETDLPDGRNEDWERMFGKQAASAAHIYGLPYAAAEALTVIQKHWEHSPFQLKKTVDQAFCSGLNRLMIHTFTHSSPEVRAPGYEYFAGTHFNPQITWWDQAHAFTGYISRSQYLLQQGHFVADVCYYQGDQIPAFVPMKQIQPGLGAGYDYDIINTEVLMTRLSVIDGWLVLPDGMRYRLMVLPDSDMMNPMVLQKIADLVEQGATIIGRRPSRAYGLQNYPHNDSLIVNLAAKLWSDCDGYTIRQKSYGSGRIICNIPERKVLIEDGILPDFEYSSVNTDAKIDFIHRRIADSGGEIDIYFVINSKDIWEEVDCTFRIDDRKPELWDAATGEIDENIIYHQEKGRTNLPLRLAPYGSAFIVFRKRGAPVSVVGIRPISNSVVLNDADRVEEIPVVDVVSLDKNRLVTEAWRSGEYLIELSDGRDISTDSIVVRTPLTIEGPWEIKFPEDLGAPESAMFTRLISWTDSENEGIKYFSGTAVYCTEFSIDSDLISEETVFYLDLGAVKDLAEVSLNNQKLPVLWKPPYRVNITLWLRAGKNKLAVAITNLWPNRLIGDQKLPPEERIGFTNIAKFTKDSPLLESGLIGPVQIYRVSRQILLF